MNSRYPNIKGLEVDGFRRQLDYLADRFTVISAEDLIASVNSSSNLPSNPCLLTFDDGYRDHLLYVLPELQKRGMKGCFFPSVKPVVERDILDVNKIHFILSVQPDTTVLVDDLKILLLKIQEEFNLDIDIKNTFEAYWVRYAISSKYDSKEIKFFKSMLQYVLPNIVRAKILEILFQRYVSADPFDFASELYMSLDNVKQLVDCGMYVGSHGYRHMWLNNESSASQAVEIDMSLQFLADVGASTRDWIMCYPYGGYNDVTLDLLRTRRCLLGLTTKNGFAKIRADSLLELARFDTNDFPQ